MLTPDDIQNGNVLTGPDGDLRVAARFQTDAGQFVILSDDSGVGTVMQDGTLYDHEDYSLKTRLAASGVASAQEASEVEALRAEVDRQSRLVQALLDREGTQRQVDQAEANVPADEPLPVAPGPAAVSPPVENTGSVNPAEADPSPNPTTGDPILPDPNRPGVEVSPSQGAGGQPGPQEA